MWQGDLSDMDSVRSRQSQSQRGYDGHSYVEEGDEEGDLTTASGIMDMAGGQQRGGLHLAVIEDFYQGNYT